MPRRSPRISRIVRTSRRRSRGCGASDPEVTQLIVKINEGVSGSGNAVLDVADVAGERRVGRRAPRWRTSNPRQWVCRSPDFLDAFAQYGGVVEQRIVGEGLASPSVQMRVCPAARSSSCPPTTNSSVAPSGQAYLGCIFPADPAYSRLISEPAMRIGEHLAGLGVMGRFAVDFVVVQERGRVAGVRDRAEPAQGRHDAPVPHAAVPHRRSVRRGLRRLRDPGG